jgi:tRNA dimethylallyltransferase
MFDRGLVDEVRGLLDRWNQLSHTAMQAVGYREVIEHLRGERDLPTTTEQVLIRTRRFARHQETWFRGLSECRMIDVDSVHSPQEIAARLIEAAQTN